MRPIEPSLAALLATANLIGELPRAAHDAAHPFGMGTLRWRHLHRSSSDVRRAPHRTSLKTSLGDSAMEKRRGPLKKGHVSYTAEGTSAGALAVRLGGLPPKKPLNYAIPCSRLSSNLLGSRRAPAQAAPAGRYQEQLARAVLRPTQSATETSGHVAYRTLRNEVGLEMRLRQDREYGRESNSTKTIYPPSRPAPASAAFTLRRAVSVPGGRARCQSRNPGVPRQGAVRCLPGTLVPAGRPARGT